MITCQTTRDHMQLGPPALLEEEQRQQRQRQACFARTALSCSTTTTRNSRLPARFTINRIASRVRPYETFCRRRIRAGTTHSLRPDHPYPPIQPRDALAYHHALRAWLCRPWKGSRPSRPVFRSVLSSARTRMTTALVQ